MPEAWPLRIWLNTMLMHTALIAALALAPTADQPAGAPAPRVAYTMTFDFRPGDPRLQVRVLASGLDPARRDVSIVLSEHGEWTELDSLYLRGLTFRPPASQDPEQRSRWRFELPEPPRPWDGALEASYDIPLIEAGSELHARHPLLPFYVAGEAVNEAGEAGRPRYAAALSQNTLPVVVVGGSILRCPAEVTIVPPRGASASSGWSSTALGPQHTSLDGGLVHAPIFIGSPLTARAERNGAACEVLQFSDGDDITQTVLDMAHPLVAAYAATTGRPLDQPLRIFISDKPGGQWVPSGLLINKTSRDYTRSPYYRYFVAHELFHQWLGGYASTADDSLRWFQEGFTDYLGLWHCAAAGVVKREWFGERMRELEAEALASPAYGKVAFGQADVNWRDSDGPKETLAYKGGAVLAFGLDARLAAAGLPRLAVMIGDLSRLEGGKYTLGDIRAWLEARGGGLAEFAAAHIDQPRLPSVAEGLTLIADLAKADAFFALPAGK